jgi:hypothetical protein
MEKLAILENLSNYQYFTLCMYQLIEAGEMKNDGFIMEEPGEQCTVVFAFIVTEPAIVNLCVWAGVPSPPPPPTPLAGSVTFYATTTVHSSQDSSMVFINQPPLKVGSTSIQPVHLPPPILFGRRGYYKTVEHTKIERDDKHGRRLFKKGEMDERN